VGLGSDVGSDVGSGLGLGRGLGLSPGLGSDLESGVGSGLGRGVGVGLGVGLVVGLVVGLGVGLGAGSCLPWCTSRASARRDRAYAPQGVHRQQEQHCTCSAASQSLTVDLSPPPVRRSSICHPLILGMNEMSPPFFG
jgi:hypothetical protein